MFQTSHKIVAVIILGVALFTILMSQFTTAPRSVLAAICPTPTPLPPGATSFYADGYNDAGCSNGPYIYSGVRSDMECANPTIRTSTGFSIMRAAVAHKSLSDPVRDGAYIEVGCVKDPHRFSNQDRYVYGSWVPLGIFI
jgi:hypothetical protein